MRMRMRRQMIRVHSSPSSSSFSPPTGFTDRYEKAFTMAELYALERPPPIPLTEHQERRKRKDTEEIVEAAIKRRGQASAPLVRQGLKDLDTLLPDLVDLHKLKAADWATVALDVNEVAGKLVALKTVFPGANAFQIVSKMPKMLLKTTATVTQEAEQVRKALSSCPEPDAIVEAVPDLVDPVALAKALATIKAAMPGKNPLEVLQKTPSIMYSLGGEADIGDSAEYGELSTKD